MEQEQLQRLVKSGAAFSGKMRVRICFSFFDCKSFKPEFKWSGGLKLQDAGVHGVHGKETAYAPKPRLRAAVSPHASCQLLLHAACPLTPWLDQGSRLGVMTGGYDQGLHTLPQTLGPLLPNTLAHSPAPAGQCYQPH